MSEFNWGGTVSLQGQIQVLEQKLAAVNSKLRRIRECACDEDVEWAIGQGTSNIAEVLEAAMRDIRDILDEDT